MLENKLRNIILESVREVLNEISPEMKARAMVKANHDRQRLGQSNNEIEKNLNGQSVHKDTQQRRRDRQIMAFKKGLENDLTRRFNKHPKDIKFSINSYKTEDEPDYSNDFRVSYEDDKFSHHSTNNGETRGSHFYTQDRRNPDINHRDMKAIDYITNMVDGMAGYDSELKGHVPYNTYMNWINDRADDVDRNNKYEQDKRDYEERKDAHEREISRYNSLPWYKKPFKQKPSEFNAKKPEPPVNKTGPYFMPRDTQGLYKHAEKLKANHKINQDAYNKYLKK